MSRRHVVPLALSREVLHQLGVLLGGRGAHPGVGIAPDHAVRDVLVRDTSGRRRPARWTGRIGHGRQRTRLGRGGAALALVAATLLPAAVLSSSPPAQAAAADGGTFTVGLGNEVDSFNPFLGIEATSFEMWALTYDYLISYAMEDMAPEPGLATEWDTSDDGLTWTFTIREGVMWSDGQPLTANDIAYTYNRVL